MKILLVEDNKSIAKGLIYSLEQNSYEVLHSIDVKNANKFIKEEIIDLVLLDISLPDGNGFELYEKVIKDLKIPVIFLTAKDDEDDVVHGLELGAEDYITKPFGIKELLARINKILLRRKQNTILKVKNIKFDIDKMVVYRNDEQIELTSLELKILHLLFSNLNKVVTRNEIIDIYDNTVTVYMKRIREKLQEDIICTIKGIGYRIDEK